MFRAPIKEYLANRYHQVQIMCWSLFLAGIAGYWLFQHDLILASYADYGVNHLTVLCLLLLVCLLSYSLSRKLHLNIDWYYLSFVPGILILALVANETISFTTIAITIITLAIWIILILRQPRLKINKISSNLYIFVLSAIIALSCSNTSELTHNKYKIQHLLSIGNYEQALQVGSNSTLTDSTLFNLRTKALFMTNQLGSKLFAYPIPHGCCHISADIASGDTEAKDIVLCNLLLQKNLSGFAQLLPRLYDIHSKQSSLPQHYKEALVLYMSRSTNPTIDYSDTLIETNYADFLAEKNKYDDNHVMGNSKCHQLYGTTYFWYYYFSDNTSDSTRRHTDGK